MKPTNKEVEELTQIEPIEIESEGVIHEDLQMKIDDTFTLELTKEEHKLFMLHANMFLQKNEWLEIQDTTGKAFYFLLQEFVKNNEAFFELDSYNIELNYSNVWVVNRFSRIAQIEINEENEEQRFFQGIVERLFNLI